MTASANRDAASPVSSFSELRYMSLLSAQLLASHVGAAEDSNTLCPIGLLCTSSLDFILTWLGLMRLGYSTLFLA